MLEVILYILAFLVITSATVTDLKTREVPDLLSYSLIFSAIGLRLVYSYYLQDIFILLDGIVGLGIMFLLACLMYYTGQWGGGDAKLLMGLGTVFGLSITTDFQLLYLFLVNLVIFGSMFGLTWSFYLFVRDWDKSKKEFLKLSKSKQGKVMRIFLFVLGLLNFILAYYYLPFIVLGILFILMYYVWVYTKVVETVSMLKRLVPTKLTEGDWVAEEIFVNGHKICGPKDLGIDQDQIDELLKLYQKGKIRNVLIKEGLPFIPSFFIAYIITFLVGNWIILLF